MGGIIFYVKRAANHWALIASMAARRNIIEPWGDLQRRVKFFSSSLQQHLSQVYPKDGFR